MVSTTFLADGITLNILGEVNRDVYIALKHADSGW
jgi:hypothetical protein